MSIIAEFREFFTRHTQVSSGTKADQELGFPVEYTVSGNLEYNRFLKGDHPSEAVSKKLFQSIAFKLNVEDTASETGQGLVKTATDQNVVDRNSEQEGAMRSVVQPHQLTEIVPLVTQGVDFIADTHSGNAVLDNINPDLTGLTIGGFVVGDNIPAQTTIIALDYVNGNVTLSNNCIGTGTGISISQLNKDVLIDKFTYGGLFIGRFKRTVGNFFRKIYEVRLAFSADSSIVVDYNDQTLKLSGDQATPGNTKVYGTNGSGVKGWYNKAISPALVYNALITQPGTDPLTAIVLEKTFSPTVTWSKISTGVYHGVVSSPIFDAVKTILVPPSYNFCNGNWYQVKCVILDYQTIELRQSIISLDSTVVDGTLSNFINTPTDGVIDMAFPNTCYPLMILVYP